MNCPNCGVPLMGGMTVCPKCKYDTRSKDGGELFKARQGLSGEEWVEIQREKRQQEENQRKEVLERMLLTTCPSVEGYRIKRQCGLVFGEIAFKTGFFKSLGAALDNLGDIISFGDKELSGTAKLLANAREYAMTKLKEETIRRGANAVIGIDAESSFGGDLMHITIYGTAVVLEKIDE